MAAQTPPPPRGGELGERRLGTMAAVAQALAIGPMFSTALVLSLVSNPDNGSTFNTALSVLIAGLGVLAIAYAISLFARRYQGAGAVYEYLTHGAHPSVGVFVAGIFFVGTLFLGGGGIYLGLGILTQGFWATHVTTSTIPAWWLFGLIFLALVLALNYVGIRLAIGLMLGFAAVSFTAMTILALAIIVKGGQDGNTLQMFNPGTTSLGTVFNGVLLGILLFVGFEAAASLGEESHDPHRSIPRALLWTVGVSGAFFVLMAYAISIGLGKAAVDKGAWLDPATLDNLAKQYVSSWYAGIIDLVVILDATALALAICVTIGRGYFALGRDGLLPSVFARTSRHNTPWVGNLMVIVGGGGLTLIGALQPHDGPLHPDRRHPRVQRVPRVGDGRLLRDRARLPGARAGGDRPARPPRRQLVAVPDRPHRSRNPDRRVLRCTAPGAARQHEPELARRLLGARRRRPLGGVVRPDAGLEARPDPERRRPCGGAPRRRAARRERRFHARTAGLGDLARPAARALPGLDSREGSAGVRRSPATRPSARIPPAC